MGDKKDKNKKLNIQDNIVLKYILFFAVWQLSLPVERLSLTMFG